jgi:hypothetical protein
MDVDKIEHDFDANNHFSSLVFNEHIRQSCQFLSGHEVDQNIHSNSSSCHSSFENFHYEKVFDNETHQNSDSPQLLVNMEEEKVVFDILRGEESIHNFSLLEIIDSEIMES